MKQIICIILILISGLNYSQNKQEIEVFKKIIDHETSKGEIFIRCEKSKTNFNVIEFEGKIKVNIPENILEELNQSSKFSTNGVWDTNLIKTLSQKYGSNFIKKEECLTIKDAELLFKKTEKRQSIVSISQPIFDSKFEHCIISVSYLNFTGNAYGHKYFLKKVYGIWTIIVEFSNWMT